MPSDLRTAFRAAQPWPETDPRYIEVTGAEAPVNLLAAAIDLIAEIDDEMDARPEDASLRAARSLVTAIAADMFEALIERRMGDAGESET